MEEVSQSPETQTGSNKNRNLIIGVAAAIVICCCCAGTALAGYYGFQAYTQTQQAIEEFQNFEIPEIPTSVPFEPFDPGNPGDTDIPSFDYDFSDIPSGGLADDETRLTAWFSVQLISMISGCENPVSEGTTITVVQQPDSRGVWVEEWNVNCGNGASQAHKVTFTPENGIVNVNVELPSP